MKKQNGGARNVLPLTGLSIATHLLRGCDGGVRGAPLLASHKSKHRCQELPELRSTSNMQPKRSRIPIKPPHPPSLNKLERAWGGSKFLDQARVTARLKGRRVSCLAG